MKSNQVIDMLNQNVADLHILYVKLHNYHWNVEGRQFFEIHKVTEEYYNHIAELYDAFAERVLQLGGKPPVTVKEYLELAQLSEENANRFGSNEIIDGLFNDFTYLLNSYRSILAVAEENGDVVTADMVSDTIGWLEKTLWMLKATQK